MPRARHYTKAAFDRRAVVGLQSPPCVGALADPRRSRHVEYVQHAQQDRCFQGPAREPARDRRHQVGLTPELSVPEDITEQADQAFTNLRNVLEAAGSSLANVTQLTMYYTDIGDSQAVDKVFTKFFPERYPARTAVQVVSLVLPQLKLEIQASAVLDD